MTVKFRVHEEGSSVPVPVPVPAAISSRSVHLLSDEELHAAVKRAAEFNQRTARALRSRSEYQALLSESSDREGFDRHDTICVSTDDHPLRLWTSDDLNNKEEYNGQDIDTMGAVFVGVAGSMEEAPRSRS